LSIDQLYDIASDAIDETQFNYGSHNRGMAMRNDLGKLSLMFMTYTANMVTIMTKHVHRGLKGATKAERSESRKLMGNMMLNHFAAAGAIGLPMVEAVGEIFASIASMIDDEDEPEDFKQWLDETIRHTVGMLGGDPQGDTAKFISTLTRKGVFNAALGINVADRVGLNNLIWRSDNRPDSTGQEAIMNALYGISPVVSIAGNFANGYGRFTDGLEQNNSELAMKGLQGLFPKAIADVLKASRQGMYGENTLSGSPLVDKDEISWFDIASQSIGLSSESLRDTYERRGREFTNNKVVSQRRSTLVKLAASDVLAKNNLDATLARIKKFNDQHPMNAISADTISKHLQAKQGRNAQTIDGVYYPKKRMGEAGQDKYYD